jgi:uncharacterized membrane protein (UPF0127 family)
MRFTIDVVFIDENYRVVGMREVVRPFSVTWPLFRAKSLLELPAHTIFKTRTGVGDQLLIDRYEARRSEVQSELAQSGLTPGR